MTTKKPKRAPRTKHQTPRTPRRNAVPPVFVLDARDGTRKKIIDADLVRALSDRRVVSVSKPEDPVR